MSAILIYVGPYMCDSNRNVVKSMFYVVNKHGLYNFDYEYE